MQGLLQGGGGNKNNGAWEKIRAKQLKGEMWIEVSFRKRKKARAQDIKLLKKDNLFTSNFESLIIGIWFKNCLRF